jgi:hypothetical protein
MKIVKQFEDREFLLQYYNWCAVEHLSWAHFYWGLGDDGNLYAKCDTFTDPHRWYPTISLSDMEQYFQLKLMKRIVKEFGHLVVFL